MIGTGGAALLLAGSAGSGKSTLAYAASKAGLEVFSDDAAYIQLEPRRVWGVVRPSCCFLMPRRVS
jgi:serine kinase of HPr protein (carbohydrate metabolism regulator)